MHTFIPGIDLGFDERGIPSRSCLNPVRQYNKDKPNKYSVDFLVLSNSSKKLYFIQHVDVYQGKNAENINIPDFIKDFPTTQKEQNSMLLLYSFHICLIYCSFS